MNKKAFTLIELAIVAIIVGILVLIGIPNMLKSINRNYALDAMRNLMAIYTAEKKYFQDSAEPQHYAPSCVGLAAINNALGLNIVSGGTTYSCLNFTGPIAVCSAIHSSFTMKFSTDYPVTINSTPVYCANGNPSDNSNLCCYTANATLYGKPCP